MANNMSVMRAVIIHYPVDAGCSVHIIDSVGDRSMENNVQTSEDLLKVKLFNPRPVSGETGRVSTGDLLPR